MSSRPQSSTFTTRFFPASRASGRLVVVLHGLGDSLEGFLWMPELLGLAEVNYLLVNAPKPYVIGFQWYDIMDPAQGVLESRSKLLILLEELQGQGWAAEDIVIFGFSQGCLMAIDIVTRYDKALAGVVGVSGYTFDMDAIAAEMHPQAKEQSWLITHGTHDELLPLSRTQKQIEQLKSLGLPIEWHVFDKAHTIDPTDEIALFRNWIQARWPT